ncbi:hypothetical protein SDC9_200844 [bioreactor metagenome]|uniref:Uncharacterized protein n=1 Tax=bioreactor metagenome TaxID=1076179 RepID=A0A645IQ74_9ZZZZ
MKSVLDISVDKNISWELDTSRLQIHILIKKINVFDQICCLIDTNGEPRTGSNNFQAIFGELDILF